MMASDYSWYGLTDRSDTGVDTDQNWHADFEERYCCSSCNYRKPELSHEPIDIKTVERPPLAPIVVQHENSVHILLRSFLELFEDVLDDSVLMGKVYGPDNKTYDQFVTVTTCHMLPIRGTKESLFKICSTCKRPNYYPMPFNYGYVTVDSLKPGRLLYIHRLEPLVIRSDLLSRIDAKTRRRLRITELPVKTEAEDGIEDFPTLYM